MLRRVAAGTAVYICLVVLAAPFPHAAGLMLTFPALNGLAFFFAEQPSIGPMARSMLWLPVINADEVKRKSLSQKWHVCDDKHAMRKWWRCTDKE